jgi:hypothetical protein
VSAVLLVQCDRAGRRDDVFEALLLVGVYVLFGLAFFFVG